MIPRQSFSSQQASIIGYSFDKLFSSPHIPSPPPFLGWCLEPVHWRHGLQDLGLQIPFVAVNRDFRNKSTDLPWRERQHLCVRYLKVQGSTDAGTGQRRVWVSLQPSRVLLCEIQDAFEVNFLRLVNRCIQLRFRFQPYCLRWHTCSLLSNELSIAQALHSHRYTYLPLQYLPSTNFPQVFA